MRLANRETYVRSTCQHSNALISRATALKFLGLIGIVMMVALTKIYLERCATTMGQEWMDRHRELSQLIDENNNLRMRREKFLAGGYIIDRAMELELRPSDPGQVRHVDWAAYHGQVNETDETIQGEVQVTGTD
jgi:hypothetical protein